MRHISHLFLIISLLLTTSCSDEPTAEQPFVIGKVGVRSDRIWDDRAPQAATSRSTTVLTYVLEVWTTGDTPRRVLRQRHSGSDVLFDLRLIPGTYDFLFWADAGAASGYNTDNALGLRAVTLTTPYTPGAEHDAYACVLKGVTAAAQFTLSATLHRPLSCLIIRNKDDIPLPRDTPVSVTYHNLPTQYDVLTGKTSAPLASLSVPLETLPGNTAELGTDFLFTPGQNTPASAEITVGEVTKTLDPLPFETNKRTIITAVFNIN